MKTIELDVAVTPHAFQPEWTHRVGVIIDVLRASSTIVTLLEQGCSAVFVVSEEEEALNMRGKPDLLLSGERNGLKLPGFEMGNSPCEVLNKGSMVQGKRVVLTTTNGTRVIELVSNCRALLAGCLLNAKSCSLAVFNLALEMNCHIVLVCAGEKGNYVLDDAYCAGCLTAELCQLARKSNLTLHLQPSSQSVLELWEKYDNSILAFEQSWSGQRLLEIGQPDDLEFCSRLSIYDTVPIMHKNGNNIFFTSMVNKEKEGLDYGHSASDNSSRYSGHQG